MQDAAAFHVDELQTDCDKDSQDPGNAELPEGYQWLKEDALSALLAAEYLRGYLAGEEAAHER